MNFLKDAPDGSKDRREPELVGGTDLSQVLARRGGLTEDDIKRVEAVQDQLGLGKRRWPGHRTRFSVHTILLIHTVKVSGHYVPS